MREILARVPFHSRRRRCTLRAFVKNSVYKNVYSKRRQPFDEQKGGRRLSFTRARGFNSIKEHRDSTQNVSNLHPTENAYSRAALREIILKQAMLLLIEIKLKVLDRSQITVSQKIVNI
jgi:hypothetical protein